MGTQYTMQDGFYQQRLAKHGITALTPALPEQTVLHRIIVDELVRGILTPESKQSYLHSIRDLIKGGAQGVILGCTEIPLLIKAEDCPLPLFDTAILHAEAALNRAIA
jgi:aspartate racemase